MGFNGSWMDFNGGFHFCKVGIYFGLSHAISVIVWGWYKVEAYDVCLGVFSFGVAGPDKLLHNSFVLETDQCFNGKKNRWITARDLQLKWEYPVPFPKRFSLCRSKTPTSKASCDGLLGHRLRLQELRHERLLFDPSAAWFRDAEKQNGVERVDEGDIAW